MKSQSSLKQCQQLFLQSVIGPQAISQSEPLNTGRAKKVTDLSLLLSHDIRSPAERISIYQNNYQLALLSCLKSTFIHTKRLLGERTFNKWALEYIDAHPSQSEYLNQYGEYFARFIFSGSRRLSDGESKRSLAIFHVAQSDYVKQCCYYAGNNQALPINAFINMPLDVQMNTDFVRQPSLFLMASSIDLTGITSLESIEAVPIQEGLIYYLFFRNEGKVQVKAIAKMLFDLLFLFEKPNNMNGLNESQLELLPILLREGWLKLTGAML